MNNIYKEISNSFLSKSYINFIINPSREPVFNLKINNNIGSIHIYIKNRLEYRKTGIRLPPHNPVLLNELDIMYRMFNIG